MYQKLKFKIQNKWKASFWGLLILNIVILLGVLLLIFYPASPTTLPKQSKNEPIGAEFTISSTKDNLNDYINSYLSELSAKTGIYYSVSIEDEVKLTGTIIAFEKKVPLTATFEPIVQENGDLVLELNSIALGALQLPNKRVLDYVKKNYPMPDWIVVNPNEQFIYAAITEMNLKSDFNIRAEQFNLEDETISFIINAPKESFNISF
ncbi:YpmS family protein [Salirhabdus salicampi]|uniref:YpmS family protein n=1 Tax=Salirhabdus salicampi TaxID=476102 RepID=UPI0020C532DB|nr:YpmS family protein [Salirhabdus salicampi]MCP8617345.1 YpmS family protein [Salirhabdus salicampi]